VTLYTVSVVKVGRTGKIVQAWKNGAKFDVRCEDALAVLEEFGFDLRRDAQHHWLATHENLRSHPQFPFGRFGVNCHYQGKQGVVHPSAINDILKAIKHLGEYDDEP
jgi:hypothetical protein